MNKVLSLTYESSLTHLTEANSSFDSGVLAIAYHGDNKNGSSISKESFEGSIRTMYNCPIACNYDRESDSLGGHDVEVVSENDGKTIRLAHMTTPIGLIPESAKYWWEERTEEDGTINEYLCVDVLLWKRQEGYRKVKRDGFAAHSMEITVKNGETIDGIFHIYDFEFTAFVLIGENPCFESSSIEFSKNTFREEFSQMVTEMKETFKSVETSTEDNDIHPKNYSAKGGKVLDKKKALVAKYEMAIEDLDFSLEDLSIEEIEERLKSIKKEKDFGLESNFLNELIKAIETETVETEWGTHPVYYFNDYDKDVNEVYVFDSNDWNLYGFTYAVDGDVVSIDFNSKKRMKIEIVDFDEGEQKSPFAEVFAVMKEKLESNANAKKELTEATEKISSMSKEIEELRSFKKEVEDLAIENEKNEIFGRFEDLVGIEAFEELKLNSKDYDANVIEEKCFAIRGRKAVVKFSKKEDKAPVLAVKKDKEADGCSEYGGLFHKYGIKPDKA